jgi:thiamine biosynthesis lipoprotein
MLPGCIKKMPLTMKEFKESRHGMGTIFEIKVFAADSALAATSMQKAFALVDSLQQKLDRHNDSSLMSRINQAAGKGGVVVDNETARLLAASKLYYEYSEHAFDITIGPLVRLWNQHGKEQTLPSDSAVAQAKKMVTGEKLTLRGDTVLLADSGMSIDLGGIAKGYAVDQMVALLQAADVSAGLVNAGGNLRCWGRKPDGTDWEIGVRHPRQEGLYARIKGFTGSVASSGDYERFFELNGKRYHHILDPRIGWPAEGCVSTTILAPTALEADGLSTTLFLLGPAKGLALLEKLPDVEGAILYFEGDSLKSVVSSGLKDRLVLE